MKLGQTVTHNLRMTPIKGYATGGKMTSRQMMDGLHPMGRIGTPDEVAGLIVWLCSAEAGFMTGAVVPVDGGFVAQ